MRKITLLLLLTITMFSCTPTKKFIKFPAEPKEIFQKQELTDYFKENAHLSIVLRMPKKMGKATNMLMGTAKISLFTDRLESELLKNGYNVRDRVLFNQIVDKADNAAAVDYSKIKELANTDLIFEVVNINLNEVFTTKRYTAVSAKKTVEKTGKYTYRRRGEVVEFRILLAKKNEIAGIYKFKYAPICPEQNGCPVESEEGSTSVTSYLASGGVSNAELGRVAEKLIQDFVQLVKK